VIGFSPTCATSGLVRANDDDADKLTLPNIKPSFNPRFRVNGGAMTRKTQTMEPNERPTDLLFWLRDGFCVPHRARLAASAKVSIGRTDSKRGLGFVVTVGKSELDFTLDKDQVAELAAFLQIKLSGLRKPIGRKPDQISLMRSTLRELRNPLPNIKKV
jgi:hypothetical protein